MIPHERYPAEPWRIRELGLGKLDLLAQSESVFALSNGHIGVRGNLDEGDPHGLPGTYLNSFYEERQLPYAEAGYGYPESGQTVLNVTNGKLIRMLVGDEPFDMRYGEVIRHERVLDFRAGTLFREVEWISPAGRRVLVRSTRLVSLAHRSILAIRYEVQALDEPVHVVLQSELIANEPLPSAGDDPRVAAAFEDALQPVAHSGRGVRATLLHRTASSGLHLAVEVDHLLDGCAPTGPVEVAPNVARVTVAGALEPGRPAVLTKLVGYGWSGQRTPQALQGQVSAALISARQRGWDRIVADQREVLDEFWSGADVELSGSPAIQQAVRFGLYHVFQAAARAEQRAVPAKGLTGTGYDGHAFWDTESYVLPVLIATAPRTAADELRWRWSILDQARERAATLGLSGATFPWRTIRGHECSGYWPASTAAVHVNSAIALAAARYVAWTQDDEFERRYALAILVETARLWSSLGHHGHDGRFHVDGVTGPDEYSALGDDNVYTNLTAAQNLRAAADAATRWPEESAALAVDGDEIASWNAAADTVAVPYDETTGVHEQYRGFTKLRTWRFAPGDPQDNYPLLLHAPYSELYRRQVVKQADLVLALHWCGDRFSREEKARDFAYYEPLTVRDSSLSACTQAVVGAEVGQLELAADYLAESALMDLEDLEHNTRDGLHLASLAGAWLALVHGFGGLRDHGSVLRFQPQLPPGWTRLAFWVRWRGARLHVDIGVDEVAYEVHDAGPVQIVHDQETVRLEVGAPARRRTVRVAPLTDRPGQPPGRAPLSIKDLPG